MTDPNRPDETLSIRTTVTAQSIQQLFGPPGAVDYRTHPSEREPENLADIFQGMKRKEVPAVADIKVLKGTVYSFKNRRIISRWLRDVSGVYQLKTATLCLAVQLTDAYILQNLATLPVSKCQLVAIVCLWIAAKFEEMDDVLPSLNDLVGVCDRAYPSEEFIDMEEEILMKFQWKLPHTTVANYLYLYLHMQTDPQVVHNLRRYQPPQLVASPPGTAMVYLVTVDDSKTRHVLPVALSLHEPLSLGVVQLCNALRVPLHRAAATELYELYGQDFVVAKRVPLKETPTTLQWTKEPVSLYLGVAGAPVFSNRDKIVVLRTINSMCLHVSELLTRELTTHVEFLQIPSHVQAIGVLALARCMLAPSIDDVRYAIHFILQQLSISGSVAAAVAELLAGKYKEALVADGAGSTAAVALPEGIHEKLKAVFTKSASTIKVASPVAPQGKAPKAPTT